MKEEKLMSIEDIEGDGQTLDFSGHNQLRVRDICFRHGPLSYSDLKEYAGIPDKELKAAIKVLLKLYEIQENTIKGKKIYNAAPHIMEKLAKAYLKKK